MYTCTRTCTFVPIDIEVVWCGEDGDEGGESGGGALSVHLVASILGLVSTDDGQHSVPLEKLTAGIVTEVEWEEERGKREGHTHIISVHILCTQTYTVTMYMYSTLHKKETRQEWKGVYMYMYMYMYIHSQPL